MHNLNSFYDCRSPSFLPGEMASFKDMQSFRSLHTLHFLLLFLRMQGGNNNVCFTLLPFSSRYQTVIRGVPVTAWSTKQALLGFWGMGLYFGHAGANNSKGTSGTYKRCGNRFLNLISALYNVLMLQLPMRQMTSTSKVLFLGGGGCVDMRAATANQLRETCPQYMVIRHLSPGWACNVSSVQTGAIDQNYICTVHIIIFADFYKSTVLYGVHIQFWSTLQTCHIIKL